MVIENKIKWIFIIVLLIAVFFSNYFKYQSTFFESGVCKNFSVTKGKENVELLFNIKTEVSSTLSIKSFTNNWTFSDNFDYSLPSSKDMLVDGMKQKPIVIPKAVFNDAKSGIYLVNNKVPFIIKDSVNESDVTIVYPYMNNAIYERFNDQSVFSRELVATSLNRPISMSGVSNWMTSFFKNIESSFKVSYITDLDLEDMTGFKNTKVLVLYGRFGFSTTKMRKNIFQFLEGGGKVLLVCTKFLNNFCEYNQKENKVIFNPNLYQKKEISSKSHLISNYDLEGAFIDDQLGVGYGLACEVFDNKGYEVIDANHEIFEGLSQEIIPVTSNFFIGGITSGSSSKLPYFDRVDALALYNSSCPANRAGVMGILECKAKKGTLVSLGTGNWFETYNYSSSEVIKRVTLNSLNYLLKN